MQPSYKYFAFISFQSADAREAARLQHTIESYRLPAVLCRQDNTLPRCIKPLYCYLNDMHAGEELMQELKLRMEQSRYLIVVCSPHSSRSNYVNSGIDFFISLGRRDSIIPVIVDGVPYSEEEAIECFPESLRRHFPKHTDPLKDHSILGINIREAGISRREAYNRAMLMVVARMLQLDFDGLLLRDKQRRRRRTVLRTFMALLVTAALIFTWHKAQTIDVSLQVSESTAENTALPPCRDIRVRLDIGDETKTDTLGTLSDTALFQHIPPQFIGREVHLYVEAEGYLPLDTTLLLSNRMQISLRRDPDLYGHIHFRIYGPAQPELLTVQIANQLLVPDRDGRVEMHIPIAEQQTAYPVEVKGSKDTLFMPCGPDDVIVIEP